LTVGGRGGIVARLGLGHLGFALAGA
jgi:hypothetical protein